MQQNELVVTRPEQARALQDTTFLGRFLHPASPSDVARALRMPANLAHHHAKRHADLGLLLQTGRKGGKVYYQLAAKTFKHPRALLPVDEAGEPTAAALRLLVERFQAAYEACDLLVSGQSPDWHYYAFDKANPPKVETADALDDAYSARPAHFQARTLALTPERYRELVGQISALIDAAATDDDPRAQPCTVALLAMDGPLQEGATDSQYLSSFIPPERPHPDTGKSEANR